MKVHATWSRIPSGIPKSRETRERIAQTARQEAFGAIDERTRAIDRMRIARKVAEINGRDGLFVER